MRVRRVVFPILLFLLGSLATANAQQPQPKKPSGKPAKIVLEDAELYFAFFRAHNAVDQKI